MKTTKKITRFRVYCLYPRCVWGLEITHGFEGNYEHEYLYFSTWRRAYDHAFNTAKRWRYPEGWQP